LQEENIKLPNTGYAPKDLGDGLELSTPELENIDESVLKSVYNDFYDEDKYPTIRSLLVLKNGKLVSEAYFKDDQDLIRPHAIQSATKSITSILTGIAIDKGFISSTQQTVENFFPNYVSGEKENITIAHLLAMSAGIDFNNDTDTEKMINEADNSIKYALSFDLKFSPGSNWLYCDGNNQVVSGIVAQTTEMTLEEFGKKYLFDPLGIKDYRWERHKDNTTYGAIGLWLTPRSMAKIGLMVLNMGIYDNQRIVSEEWLSTSTAKQNPARDYGFNWSIFLNYGYYASGHGGQKIYVFPQEQMVIVTTADSYSANWIFLDDIEQIANRIREAG
jgi:CubicO group peptidase (beta-lactamase class C family)